MRRSAARGCLWIIFVILVTSLGVWLLRERLLTAAAAFLVEDDGPHKADVAVMLGGDEYGNRVLTAAQLARNGYVPYVLVSFPDRFGDCDSGKLYAEGKGFSASLFRDKPTHAKSTREEVKDLDDYFRQHGLRKILLVTSNYHTHRAVRLMRRQDSALEVWAIPAPDPYFTPSRWWRTREGQKTFVYEWMKTIAAWLGN